MRFRNHAFLGPLKAVLQHGFPICVIN
jgi:hypothetical protein